jgi:hypothetical protein
MPSIREHQGLPGMTLDQLADYLGDRQPGSGNAFAAQAEFLKRKRQPTHALNHDGVMVDSRRHFSVRRDRDERAHIRQS